MDLGGVISAGGDLGSAVVSGLFGQNSARNAMHFEKFMSSTAYQRAARDLEKAGLNRILALGNPASTPPGVTASMPDARVGSSFQAGSSAAAQRRVMSQTEELTRHQIGVADSTKASNEAAAIRDATQANLNRANARLVNSNADQAEVTKEIYRRSSPYLDKLFDKVDSYLADPQSANKAVHDSLLDWMIRKLRPSPGDVGGLPPSSASSIRWLYPDNRLAPSHPQSRPYNFKSTAPGRGRQGGVK